MVVKQRPVIAGVSGLLLLLSTAGGNAGGMEKTSTSDGMVTLSGTYVGQGVNCPQFRLEDGETISLSGNYPALVASGGPIVLTGRWARESKCMQGREFRVFR